MTTDIACSRTFSSVAEAEAAVAESPKDSHNFSRCDEVRIATGTPEREELAKQMLTEAGYVYDAARRGWAKPGFFAQAYGYAWSDLHIDIYVDGVAAMAYACGENGYLPRGDSQEI